MFPPRAGRQDHATVRLRDAHAIVESLSLAVEEDLPRRDRIRRLVERCAPLIGSSLDYHVLLLGDLHRQPAPRVLDRVTCGPTFELIEPRDDKAIQQLIDLCGPICEQAIPTALAQLRSPATYVYSEDSDAKWYRDVFEPRLLAPNRWVDDMACYWCHTPGRVIIYNAFRPEGSAPYTPQQRDLLSLACRAAAPIVDGAFLDVAVETLTELDERLYPVLLCVLQGMSRREMAEHAGVMSDHVDIALRRLYDAFGVETRGQLMALFIDRRVDEWLAQAIERNESA
jgi:hypothetical protein